MLKLRHHETEVARRELASAMAGVAAARQTVNDAVCQLEELLDSPSMGSSLSGMRRLAEMRAASIDVVHKAKAYLAEALGVELESREAVFNRLQRQEALEKLKEHQRDEFEEVHRKTEQRMMDEFSIIAHGRTKLITL